MEAKIDSTNLKTSNSKLANKIKTISQLISEYKESFAKKENSLLIIILEEWLKEAQKSTDETKSEDFLGEILIKNYLTVTQDHASLLMKLSLPEIFKKKELEKILEKNVFTPEQKENFEAFYLNNIVETKPQINLNLAQTLFSTADIQKVILSKKSSAELLKLMTTNQLSYSLITEILFERDDELASKFQAKKLENWFIEINKGENPQKVIFSDKALSDLTLNGWIIRINACLIRPNLTLQYRVHCIKLLQFLSGSESEEINASLKETISKVNQCEALQIEGDTEFNAILKEFHEHKRFTFLNAVMPGAKLAETIDDLLDKIEQDKDQTTKNLANDYLSLIRMAEQLDEKQFERAVNLCFSKATEAGGYNPNYAHEALFGIIEKSSTLPDQMQTLFFEILNDDKGKKNVNEDSIFEILNDYKGKKNVNEDSIFKILLHFANANHPEILPFLTNLIITRMSHDDSSVKECAYWWLSLLEPKLKEIPEALITELIKAINIKGWQRDPGRSLQTISGKLSNLQLTNYLYQYLPLLASENKDEIIRGCRIISALAKNLASCPADIILSLISLTEHQDSDISDEARSALLDMEPHFLIMKSGLIKELLKNESENSHYSFDCIIKFSPLLSSEDIDDELINNLVHAKDECYRDHFKKIELKKKALNLFSQQLNDSQLNTYVSCCLQWKSCPEARQLIAVPIHLLNGRLDPLITQLSNMLEDKENYYLFQMAAEALPRFKSLLPLFPEKFLFNFIQRINDEDYRVCDVVRKVVPELLSLIKKQDINDFFDFFVSYNSSKKEVGDDRIHKTARKYLTILAPSLNQEQITKLKKALIIALDDERWTHRLKAFKYLTKIAHRFEGEELNSLFDTLIAKADQNTFKYLREIAYLFKDEAQSKLVNLLFASLEDQAFDTRAEACLTLISMLPYLKPELVSELISKFIVVLKNQESDLVQQIVTNMHHGSAINNDQDRSAALNGLIMLADRMTKDDLTQVQDISENNCEIIVGKYVLKSLFDLKELAPTPPKEEISSAHNFH